MLYLPEDLYEKLKGEENSSALIQTLLRNHYSLVESPKDKLDEIKKNIEKQNQEAHILEKRVEEMEKRKDEIVQRGIEEAEKNEYNSKDKWERQRPFLREVFNNWEIEKDKIEGLFDEFFDLIQEGKVGNIIEFMQIKKINKKEKKIGKQ